MVSYAHDKYVTQPHVHVFKAWQCSQTSAVCHKCSTCMYTYQSHDKNEQNWLDVLCQASESIWGETHHCFSEESVRPSITPEHVDGDTEINWRHLVPPERRDVQPNNSACIRVKNMHLHRWINVSVRLTVTVLTQVHEFGTHFQHTDIQ